MIVHQAPAGPAWKAVMGAQVLFAPIDRGLVRRARRAALKALGRDEHGPEPEGDDLAVQLEDLGDALSLAMIVEGVLDWRGPVLRQEDGSEAPLPFSRDALLTALSDPVHFDAFDAVYVMPYATREREKNASAASPSGTGEAATREKATASTAAKPRRRGGAKPAPIGRTRRKAETPMPSGTS